MRYKGIIEQHRQAIAEAKGQQEESGVFIGIMIEVKPLETWAHKVRMSNGSIRSIATAVPPNTPDYKPVVVKQGACCVVM